jgi:hypothetical protein
MTAPEARATPEDGSFTLASYRSLLERTIALYDPVGFDALGDKELSRKAVCLIRHDIDISPSRALRMAHLEAELGVRGTYTVLMTGRFYNPLERDVRDLLLEISALGHNIGLHFDAAWHGVEDEESLSAAVSWEAETLGKVLKGVPIRMFSFHDPSDRALAFLAPQYAGLWNAYAGVQRENFSYLSDSNGYWRFRSWTEALDERPERLHVLTHPEWWIEHYLPPAERISTAIGERATTMWQNYCAGLRATQRDNKSDIPNAVDILPRMLGAKGDRIAQLWLSGEWVGAYLQLLQEVRREKPSGSAIAEIDRLARIGGQLVCDGPGLAPETLRAGFEDLALLLERRDAATAPLI